MASHCITGAITMSIRVRYFASLREHVGRSGDELVYETPLSAREAWQRLNPDLPMPEAMLAAIDMEYVNLDTVVVDGSELAFFPPVTGG